jgi:hypothetical protein
MHSANGETNIFDASLLRLEVRIEFNLPKNLEKDRMKSASLAFFGRDLFNFTKFLVLILKEESK